MCGIAGYSLSTRSDVDRTLAAQSLLTGIAERGADAVDDRDRPRIHAAERVAHRGQVECVVVVRLRPVSARVPLGFRPVEVVDRDANRGR